MSEEEKYSGYGWIKVQKGIVYDFDGPVEIDSTRRFVAEKHHVEETTFLIDKIRELAKVIDKLQADLTYYRRLEEARSQYAAKQARWEQDSLPYQEDDRDR